MDDTSATFSITCTGFKNPISQGLFYGFIFTSYDNELNPPNEIEKSESVAIDASNYLPAAISAAVLNIQPRIIKIGEFSIWSISLTKFPIPLETGCYVKLVIPRDLEFINTSMNGYEMFSGTSGTVVQDVIVEKEGDPRGVVVKFEGCQVRQTVGPSPQGRLEINRIKTPNARRESGNFWLEIYKDDTYTSPIAILTDGISLDVADLEPGTVDSITVAPAEFGVQVVTDYTIIFRTEHDLFIGSSIKIKFPPSIILPPTGSTVTI